MDQNAVMGKLTEIFREVFDNPRLELTDAMTARDIPSWDSVMHITLLIEIEDRFGLRFQTTEMERLRNVGELAQLVGARLSERSAH